MPKRQRPSEAPEPKQAVNWAWTLHDWSQEERDHITRAECVYMRFCEETCPTTGRRHLQGMTCVERKVVRSSLQKLLLPNRAPQLHAKPCYASLASNQEYCAKPPAVGVFEKGVCPEEDTVPGTANERADVLLALAEKGDWKTLREEHASAYLYHRRHLLDAFGATLNVSQELDGVLDNWWIWGAAGVGKDRAARGKCHPDPYIKSANTKWWCGYAGQADVILADMDHSSRLIQHEFKTWTDRYPFRGEWKGGGFQIRPQRIFVTSGYHPRDIFGHDEHLLDSVMRRFQVAHLDRDGTLRKERRLMIAMPPPIVEVDEDDEEEPWPTDEQIVEGF